MTMYPSSINAELAVGMEIEVVRTCDKSKQSDDDSYTTIEVNRTDTGVIKSIPSRQFTRQKDNYDFDYQHIMSDGSKGTIRSVDLDRQIVSQLHYDAGGDRDWDTFNLESITVTDYP